MVDYSKIPSPYMIVGVRNWIEKGIEPGSFLKAMLMNDFAMAIVKADFMNSKLLYDWAIFLLNEMPPESWGSEMTYNNWKDSHDSNRQL